MPCRCDGYPENPSVEEINHGSALAEKLCKLCSYMEDNYPDSWSSLIKDLPSVNAWWIEHKERDLKKRLEEEGRG